MASQDVAPVAGPRTPEPVASEAVEVAQGIGVDPAVGLSADEARSRLASHGPNRLAAGKAEPGWRAFLRQYEDFMQVILLAAAVVNQIGSESYTDATGLTVSPRPRVDDVLDRERVVRPGRRREVEDDVGPLHGLDGGAGVTLGDGRQRRVVIGCCVVSCVLFVSPHAFLGSPGWLGSLLSGRLRRR